MQVLWISRVEGPWGLAAGLNKGAWSCAAVDQQWGIVVDNERRAHAQVCFNGIRSVLTQHEDRFEMSLAAEGRRDESSLHQPLRGLDRTITPRGSIGGVDWDHVARHFGHSKEGKGLMSVPSLTIKLLWDLRGLRRALVPRTVWIQYSRFSALAQVRTFPRRVDLIRLTHGHGQHSRIAACRT